MKKISKIIVVITLCFIGIIQAQDIKNWRTMKPEQRKELINKMSPEERVKLLKNFRENMMVDELQVPDEKKEEFKNLYNEYQEKQNQIKERFKANKDYETLSEEDAKRELEQSFEVGQQLLDNRKKYSEKFQKVMKPQKVLQMFQNEGMMRNKMLDRKNEQHERGEFNERGRKHHESGETPERRNNTNSSGFRSQNRRTQ